MTFEPHQQEAIEKAYELLREHFDASLIVVTSVVMNQGVEAEATQMFWAGGYMCAIGHAEYAAFKIKTERDVRESPPGEKQV